MAQRQTGAIAERLMAAGRAPDEAVALISDATTPRQSVAITTLAEAARAVTTAGAPLLIVIGPVVALRAMLVGLQQTEPMTLRAEARHQSRNS